MYIQTLINDEARHSVSRANMQTNDGWIEALESLDDYCRNSFDLPTDNSLISPVTRVILQKRRLLKIHEIHNALLRISFSENEQSLFGQEFLTKFCSAFANVRWNELNYCEAQALSHLISDTLVICKADVQIVNMYMKTAIAEIQGPDLKNRQLALGAAIILARTITKTLPKQASMWANDLLRSILSILNNFSKHSYTFDYMGEALKCLRMVLELPEKFIDPKLREKIPSFLSKYLKSSNAFVSIEAAKVFETYLSSMQSLKKEDIKSLLEYLDGGLSSRLVQYKCSSNLLVFAIVFNSSDKSESNKNSLRKNIERILHYKHIDDALLASALADVLVGSYVDDYINFLSNLLPIDNSKKSVGPKCFARTVEYAAHRFDCTTQSIKFLKSVFDSFLLKHFKNLADDYTMELLISLTILQDTFPNSFTESDFSSFHPLSLPNPRLQDCATNLIGKVLENRPIVLSSQITLIFAQLKGDFLRLRHKDVNVIKDAVNGLLKLFSRILDISIEEYSNYCDSKMLIKICEWLQFILQDSREIEWLKDDLELITSILNVVSVMALKGFIDASAISLILSSFCNASGLNNSEIIFEFMLRMGAEGIIVLSHYSETLGTCLHHYNTTLPLKSVNISTLSKFLKIYVSRIGTGNSDVAMFCYISKLLVFEENLETGSVCIFENIFDNLAKLFWRCPSNTQDFVLTMWFSSLRNKNVRVKKNILKAIKAMIECYDVKFEGNDHRSLLIEHIQSITREFINESEFETRLECGNIIGLMVRLSVESEVLNQLFEQIMKHAVKDNDSNKLSRICYIMALVSFRANLDGKTASELTPNALLGLLASFNRESSNISKDFEQEIRATSLIALAYYVDKCGCSLNSEFYRDLCELLLENFFIKTRCELLVRSIKEVCGSLSVYLNLLPSQSLFIAKTLRLILESGYLNHYDDLTIQLACELSGFNPQIAEPSYLIYKILESNITHASRKSFGKICQYLGFQISYDNQKALEIIDFGLLESILNSSCMHEFIDKAEYEAFIIFIEKMINMTFLDRFDIWNEIVISRLFFNGNHHYSKIRTDLARVSIDADAVRETVDNYKASEYLSENVSFMLLRVLANRLGLLSDIDCETVKSFFSASVKIAFHVITENSDNRQHFLTGMKYLRCFVQLEARICGHGKEFENLIEGFDSQIISIISSALRFSEEGDPFYGACAFGCFFNYILIRRNLLDEAIIGSGRISGIYKKAKEHIIKRKIIWDQELVDNLTGLSILIGFCSLIAGGCFEVDHDDELEDNLKLYLKEFLRAHFDNKMEKNLKKSLSSPDYLIIIEAFLRLNARESIEIEPEVLDGVILILSRISHGEVEKICKFSKQIFSIKPFSVVFEEPLVKLCARLCNYGLESKDIVSIECLVELSETDYNHISKEFLDKIANSFLTERFGDFDGEFGIWVLKSQILLINDEQGIIFNIIDKLISLCLNEVEVNNSKEMLKCLKDLVLSSKADQNLMNDLLMKWIMRLEDVESNYLNQLLFFTVSNRPDFWNEATLANLSTYFEKLTKNLATLEMSLDSWILLLKAQSKLASECENFDSFVEHCTIFVRNTFDKNRNAEIDQVWERIFSLSLNILNSSTRTLAIEKNFVESALEDLNEFK